MFRSFRPRRAGLALSLVVGLSAAAQAQLSPADRPPTAQPAFRGLQLDVSKLESLLPAANPTVRVFGMGGGLLHDWCDPLPNWAFAELVKPLSGGRLLASIYDRSTAATGKHKILVELDWDGNVLWSFDPQAVGGWRFHHDFEREANGDTLLIAQSIGTFPWINPHPIRNELILQVTPRGRVSNVWSMAAHYAELQLSNQELHYLQGLGGSPVSVFHMNSLATLPPNPWEASDPRFRAGNLLVSLRDLNRVFIIDRQTGAIVWILHQTIGQHHARMIPAGLPGAGNILLFDNGGEAGAPPVTRGYSRILEFDPPSQTVVWQYEDRATPFFSKVMGACERLPNGNTLITESCSGRVFEITPAGIIVWQWQDPEGKDYRSYRVPFGWPAGAIQFPW